MSKVFFMVDAKGPLKYALVLVVIVGLVVYYYSSQTFNPCSQNRECGAWLHQSNFTGEPVSQDTPNLLIVRETGGVTGPSFPCCMLNNGSKADTSTPGFYTSCNVSGLRITACNAVTLDCPSKQYNRQTGACIVS